ncbi:PAS domain-containing protein [Novosphingobium sp. SG720]|uniref:PAS domain-containing protein n=1 Tax=Novosphingobium sp. SG720 TaxID=2586998 RepID=UPI001447C34F|nr:PAS domain-containing protein [Novosphingobium sp. SG720]NKJ44707.1 PAS domain S-box-containing protein [Novosphingobium sp. SG720]
MTNIKLSQQVAGISHVSLATALDQSVDCVKVIGLDGTVAYMNPNGICAMEIDAPVDVIGKQWADLWPAEARPHIESGYAAALDGGMSRFRAHCPTAKGKSRWWDVSVSALCDDTGNLISYLAVSRDVTDAELARQVLETATRELHHRLKNTYTMISSLIRGFARGDAQNAEFATEMAERLLAMGRAQALFTSRDVPCSLVDLIEALTMPFSSGFCPVAMDAVQDIPIARALADTIALVVGEFAVNSSKHGAIAHGGEIRLASRDEDGDLVIVWQEKSSRPVAATSREGGQGLNLIDRIVRLRDGAITLDWQADGLVATLRFKGAAHPAPD